MGEKTEDGYSSDTDESEKMLYNIEDRPSLPLCFFFGLQQALMALLGPVTITFLITRIMCVGDDLTVKAELLSITMFVCGLSTIIQTLFGFRIGLVQGSSSVFIPPIIALMSLPKWSCQGKSNTVNGTQVGDYDWKDSMRELQGNLIIASITQVVLGCTGTIGFLLRFIGPLTIAPTLLLLSLELVSLVVDHSKGHWGIAMMVPALMLLFSIYIGHVKIPVPSWSSQKRCRINRMPLFRLFALILGILVTWLFSYILTITDVFPSNSTTTGYLARTDLANDVLSTAPWFYWPYPFKFGTPTVSLAGYVGFLIGVITSMLESVGDYHAVARLCGAPPPPPHAVNRAIAMEGLSCIVAGLLGSVQGTTSYIMNAGAVAITKVASRAVFVTAGLILVACGVVGKFGACLALITTPIVGGAIVLPLGMIAAVGVSTMQHADMESSRNISILGIAIMLGRAIPEYINHPDNSAAIDTGVEDLDNVLRILLGTPMFVGALVGCFLDSTAPGSDEERGLTSWRCVSLTDTSHSLTVYELPLTKYIRRLTLCSYVPVSPTFNKEMSIATCKACCSSKHDKRALDGQVNEATVEVDIEVTAADKTG